MDCRCYTYNKRTNINETLLRTDYYDYPANTLVGQFGQQQNTSGTGQSIISTKLILSTPLLTNQR